MTDNTKAGSKKGRSILVLLLGVIALAGCLAAGYLWYSGQKKAEESAAALLPPPPPAPVFLALSPFTISLASGPDNLDMDRVLYVGLTLRLPTTDTQDIINEYLPETRSRLLMLLSQQTVTELSAENGKQQLIEKIKSTLSRPYIPNQEALKIDDVLFTDFILR